MLFDYELGFPELTTSYQDGHFSLLIRVSWKFILHGKTKLISVH